MTDFRNADIEDLYKVKQIAEATWPPTFGSMLPAEQLNYMLELIYNIESLRQQMEQGHRFILAEKNGDAVGFCSYEINYKASRRLMIHKVYLLPYVQGLGIGTKLLDRMTDIARLNNDTALRLKVFHLNLNAIHFYLKYGFSKSGTETTQFGNYEPILDYVMIKELQRSSSMK